MSTISEAYKLSHDAQAFDWHILVLQVVTNKYRTRVKKRI